MASLLVFFLLLVAYVPHAFGRMPPTLDDKIAHAFERYAAARAVMLERVNVDDGTIDRDEWEALIQATDSSLAMTDADITALARRQAAQINRARSRARRSSCIKLDAIRKDKKMVKKFCREMPREAILHIHPSGTRDIGTIRKLLGNLNPFVNGSLIIEKANDGVLTSLYPNEVTVLEKLPMQKYSQFDDKGKEFIQGLFFLPLDPPDHDFTRFEALFEIGDILLEQDESKDDYVEETTFLDFAERSAKLGLSYVEFTKVVIPPSRARLIHFDELKELIKRRTNVTANFVVAFVRTIKPTDLNRGWAKDLINVITEKEVDSVKGIDLLANEAKTPALETGQGIYPPVLAARRAGKVNLKSTMHSGELGDVRNVRDAMIMGTQRIGHGVLLQKDPVAMEYAKKNGIGTVVSMVSNRLLRVNSDYSKHPFLNQLRFGLPTSLSTDDEGMFLTDIGNECEIAVMNTDIQYSEMVALSRNSILESFAEEETKAELLARLKGELNSFEKAWKC